MRAYARIPVSSIHLLPWVPRYLGTLKSEVRARYFKTYVPPNTFVVVASLATPDYLLEIEAVAACPDTR